MKKGPLSKKDKEIIDHNMSLDATAIPTKLDRS